MMAVESVVCTVSKFPFAAGAGADEKGKGESEDAIAAAHSGRSISNARPSSRRYQILHLNHIGSKPI
jgi:hypothetical protein